MSTLRGGPGLSAVYDAIADALTEARAPRRLVFAADRDISPGPVPKEALSYWQQKGIKVGFDHRDVWREEHDAAFTAAKVMRADVLVALRDELDKAIQNGIPFEAWRKQIEPRLTALGWWAPHEVQDPKTGKIAQVNPPARLRLIYDTNLRISHAVGQWERIQADKDMRPFLLYQVGPSVRHREQHLAWQGLMLPVDDPFWQFAMPPNGWNCRCHVRSVSDYEAKQLRKTGVTVGKPVPVLDDEGIPTGHVVQEKTPLIIKAPLVPLVPWTNKRTGQVELVHQGIDPGFDRLPSHARPPPAAPAAPAPKAVAPAPKPPKPPKPPAAPKPKAKAAPPPPPPAPKPAPLPALPPPPPAPPKKVAPAPMPALPKPAPPPPVQAAPPPPPPPPPAAPKPAPAPPPAPPPKPPVSAARPGGPLRADPLPLPKERIKGISALRTRVLTTMRDKGMKIGALGVHVTKPLIVDEALSDLGLAHAMDEWSGAGESMGWYDSTDEVNTLLGHFVVRDGTPQELEAMHAKTTYKGPARDFQHGARATYAATQEVIAQRRKMSHPEHGLPMVDAEGYVTLYRGIHSELAAEMRAQLAAGSDLIVAKMRSISSWTSDPEIARTGFAGGFGVVVEQRVHVSRIFSMWQHQRHSNNEFNHEVEWIVMFPEEHTAVLPSQLTWTGNDPADAYED